MRSEKELLANLPTAKVVAVECRVLTGLGSKERMCAIVEYDKFVHAYSMGNASLQLMNMGKTRAAVPLYFFKDEPRGKKKKGWTINACQHIWSLLGGGNVTQAEVKNALANSPTLTIETQRLIEDMRLMDAKGGRKAMEDSIRRDMRQVIEVCEKWQFSASELMIEEVNLHHVSKVMDS